MVKRWHQVVLIAALIATIGSLALLFSSSTETTQVRGVPAFSVKSSVPDTAMLTLPSRNASSVPAAPSTSKASGVLRRFALAGKSSDSDANAVAESPDQFVKKALSGDAEAAIAVVRAVNACFPVGYNVSQTPVNRAQLGDVPVPKFSGCEKMDGALAVNRLDILGPAINAGSVEAKLMYALQARRVFGNDSYAGEMQQAYTFDQVNRRVEEYAKAAVAAGFEEGFSFLAKSYYQGDFGLREPVAAFAYASALEKVSNSGLGAYLAKTYESGLTPQQRADASIMAQQILATCCK